MLVWTGWGILAVPLFALGGVGGTSLGQALGLQAGSNAGTVVGLLAASVATWVLGRRLNRPQAGFDPRTGLPVTVANRHRLMFVPLQYVGVCGGALALVVAAQLVTA
jgi:hypothetical protein